MSERDRYILGTDDHELARLELQQNVWSKETDGWIDALDLKPGERVLDAGCGPGLASERLRKRVGPSGSVLAVDASQRWIDHVGARAERDGWDNVEARCSGLENLDMDGEFDAIFMRWVLSFPADPGGLLKNLVRALAPGGRIVIVDYNHEGISLFPRSAGFEAVVRATRALYETKGGDCFIAGRFPELFADAGLELRELKPTVIAGGPGSSAFKWADTFFPYHVEHMLESGVLSEEDGILFREQWAERRVSANTVFYSPIVVAALGVRP